MRKRLVQKLYKQYATPLHVQRHCAKVARFAISIAQKFIKKEYQVDMEKLKEASLLHDFVRIVDFRTWNPQKFAPDTSQQKLKKWEKLRSLYKGRHHADVAREILENIGEKELANLVHSHKFDNIKNLRGLEEKILYYADKRVQHDTIVSLKERLEEGYRRNMGKRKMSKSTKEIIQKIFQLEKEIQKATGSGFPND